MKPKCEISIAYIELYPIVLSALLWGGQWAHKRLVFRCHDEAMVHAINKGTSKSHPICHLLRLLTLKSMQCNFLLKAEQIPGKSDGIGDSLSHQQTGRFRQLALDADLHPTPIPVETLHRMVKYYHSPALNEKTQRIYDRGARAYQSFCSIYQIPTTLGESQSHRETRLMYFVTYCAHRLNVAFSIINTYLYWIRNWQIGYGLPDPLKDSIGKPLRRLERVLTRIKKLRPGATRVRLPITIDIMRLLVSLINRGLFWVPEDQIFLAAITLAFYEFLHYREFTSPSISAFSACQYLAVQDVVFYPTFNSPLYMAVHCKLSKTDPFGSSYTVLFSTHTLTCPVAAMKKYLSLKKYNPMLSFCALGMASLSHAQNLPRCSALSCRNWASNQLFTQDTVLKLEQLPQQKQQASEIT